MCKQQSIITLHIIIMHVQSDKAWNEDRVPQFKMIITAAISDIPTSKKKCAKVPNTCRFPYCIHRLNIEVYISERYVTPS